MILEVRNIKTLELQGYIDNYISAIMIEKFNGVGELSVIVPFNTITRGLLITQNILIPRGEDVPVFMTNARNILGDESVNYSLFSYDRGIPRPNKIKSIIYKKQISGLMTIEVKAEELTSFLGQRITSNFYDGESVRLIHRQKRAEWIIFKLMFDLFKIHQTGDEAYMSRKLENFTDCIYKPPLTDYISIYQVSDNEKLIDEVKKLAAIGGFEFFMTALNEWTYNSFPNNVWHYALMVYRTKDRSIGNSDGNAPIVFMPAFENLVEPQYQKVEDNKTTAFLDNDGYIKIINADTEKSGWDRREIYINTNINAEGMTTEEYETALSDYGKAELKKTDIVENYSGKIREMTGAKYNVDYNLGDIVTLIIPEFGAQINMRIAEAKIVYQNGIKTVSITFGQLAPTINDKLSIVKKTK